MTKKCLSTKSSTLKVLQAYIKDPSPPCIKFIINTMVIKLFKMIITSNKHEVFKTSSTDFAIPLNCQLLFKWQVISCCSNSCTNNYHLPGLHCCQASLLLRIALYY